MTNWTDEYWDVDGTSLQTLVHNIEVWPGEAPPPLRGDNVVVPHRAGSLWVPKVSDSRTITFAMWVVGEAIPASEGVTARSARQVFEDNWRSLRALLWQPNRQVSLTKRWKPGATVVSASALAQFAGGLEPDSSGPHSAKFTVDMHLADPYFYGSNVNLTGMTVGSHAVSIEGSAASPRYTVKFVGPLTNPSLSVLQGATVLSTVSYAGTIATGTSLEVSFPDFTVAGAGGSPLNVTANQRWWAVLDPAATAFVVGGSGGGAVNVSYTPAWI